MPVSPKVLSMLMLCILCGADFAATLYAGTSCGFPEALTTIQQAVDAASEGDAIIACGKDTFIENVRITKPISLRGENGRPIIRAAIASRPALAISGAGINVSGLMLRDATGSAGLYSSAASGCLITDTEATNNDIGFHLSSSTGNNLSFNRAIDNLDEGFRLSANSDGNALVGNTACSQLYYGFYIHESSENLLINNTACQSSAWYGFFLYEGAQENDLINNTANGNAHHGFHIYLNSGNRLLGNIAGNNSAEGFRLSSSSDNELFGNEAYNNSAEGFRLSSSSGNLLRGNIAAGNLRDGFLVSSGSKNTLDGNEARNNSLHGFYIHQSPDNILLSNKAYGQEDGFHIFGGSRNELRSNLAQGNGNGFYFDLSSSDEVEGNSAMNNSGHGFLFSSSSKDVVRGNLAQGNGLYGLYCYLGSDNSLSENTAGQNLDGIVLSSASKNSIGGNSASGNLRHGIYLYQSEGNVLSANSAGNNSANGIYLYESGSNTLEGNSALGNGKNGILLYLSSQCNLKDNLASGNLADGIVASSCTGSLLWGNSAQDNSGSGFRLVLGSGNGLKGDESYGNGVGCSIEGSDNADLKEPRFFNNGVDFQASAFSSSVSIGISKAIFDNPEGNLRRASTLSLEDEIEPRSAYGISWSSQPAALPRPYLSFEDKFVRINASGSISIDSITWHWTESEAAGKYKEKEFRVWQHDDSGWVPMEGQPDVQGKKITIIGFSPASTYGILQNQSPPSVELISPAAGSLVDSQDINLSYMVVSGDASALCHIRLNGALINSGGITSPSNVAIKYPVRLHGEGAYQWNVSCQDSIGTNASATQGFTFDRPPAISLAIPSEERTNSTSHALSYTAYDNVSSTLSCTLRIDGAPAQSQNSVGSGVPSVFLLNPAPEGAHMLQVSCHDGAGNIGDSPEKRLIADRTPPQITLISPRQNYLGNDSILDFSFCAHDDLSPDLRFSLYVDGSFRQSGSGNFSLPVSEGAHNWSVFAVDGAGNRNMSEVWIFTIDRTAPSVWIDSPESPRIIMAGSPASLDITARASDNGPLLSCSLIIDGNVNLTSSSVADNVPFTFHIPNLAEGTHAVNVSCTDPQGNIGTSSTKQIVVDKTAPEVSLLSPIDGFLGNSSAITFSFDASDAQTESPQCRLYLDGGPAASGTATQFTLGIGAGTHSWSVSCTDEAGNTGSSAERDLFLDLKPPSIDLRSPDNHASFDSDEPVEIPFAFTPADDNSDFLSCSLFVDGRESYSNSSAKSGREIPFNKTLGLGNHRWRVECLDGFGNRGRSAESVFFIGRETEPDDDNDDYPPRILLNELQSCPGNTITITASSGAGTWIRLLGPDGLLVEAKGASGSGEAMFVADGEGFYEAKASKSSYQASGILLYHEACPRSDTGGTPAKDENGSRQIPQQNATSPPQDVRAPENETAGEQLQEIPDVLISMADTAYPGDSVGVEVLVDGEPASVRLAIRSPSKNRTIMSDATGKAFFLVEEPGRHYVSVSQPGLPNATAYLDVRERLFDAEHLESPFRYSFGICLPFIFPLGLLLLLVLLISAYLASRGKRREGKRYEYRGRAGGHGMKLF